MTSELEYTNLNEKLQNLLREREALRMENEMESYDLEDSIVVSNLLRNMDDHIELIKNLIESYDILKEDEECPIESTTCGMDIDKKLSEEKNKELMQHGLDSLGDLL